MALIEYYHLVADMIPVSSVTNPNIVEGMFVTLNSSGNAVLATGASGTYAYGVAGDSTVQPTDGTNQRQWQSDLVIAPSGLKSPTTNRLSDPNRDETAASGKITVYTGGGKFFSDQFETVNGGSPIVYVPGTPLYVSANSKLTNVASNNNQIVAICVAAPSDYPSGVPGTDTPDGSISLGVYIEFKLTI